MEYFDKYIGKNVDEVIKELHGNIGFRILKKCAEGDKYEGPKFEVVLLRFSKENQLVTRIGAPYQVK